MLSIHVSPDTGGTAVLLCDPLFLLPRRDDEFELAAVALHLAHRGAFVEQRAGGAGHDALAALGAGVGGAPRLVEVGDDAGFAAAAGDVLGAGPFDMPAYAHAPAAEDAAVMVHAEQ